MLESIIKTGRKALYIAEIGLNHNGDADMAVSMIEAAAAAGADMVKFQTFVPGLMSSVYTADLMSSGREWRPDTSLIDFFRTFVFDRGQYRELMEAAAARGVAFFSSVFDLESLTLLEELGAALYKVASSEVTNHPLIAGVADTGKPVILSTGIATGDEISRAVDLFRGRSGAELILMHCVSLYPTMPEQVNMRRLPALRERFGLEVGFSDHTRETAAPVLAAGFGARIFEKHFTIDRNYDCPDKDISCTPDEFAAMVASVESAIAMIGTGDISYCEAEAGVARAARRSLFARRSIPRGKRIDADDLVALRPGVGMPVYESDTVIGRTSRVDIPENYLIRREYFD